VLKTHPGPTWLQGIWLAGSSTPRAAGATTAVDAVAGAGEAAVAAAAAGVDMPGVGGACAEPEHAASAAAETITRAQRKSRRVD
jgi:hypothetical protein